MGAVRALLQDEDWKLIETFAERGSVTLWHDPRSEAGGPNLNQNQVDVARRLEARGFLDADRKDPEAPHVIYFTITPKCFDQTMSEGQTYIVVKGRYRAWRMVAGPYRDNAEGAFKAAQGLRVVSRESIAVVGLDAFVDGEDPQFDDFDLLWVLD